jgi:hypothetical protein
MPNERSLRLSNEMVSDEMASFESDWARMTGTPLGSSDPLAITGKPEHAYLSTLALRQNLLDILLVHVFTST